jgi:hypothetical protein
MFWMNEVAGQADNLVSASRQILQKYSLPANKYW